MIGLHRCPGFRQGRPCRSLLWFHRRGRWHAKRSLVEGAMCDACWQEALDTGEDRLVAADPNAPGKFLSQLVNSRDAAVVASLVRRRRELPKSAAALLDRNPLAPTAATLAVKIEPGWELYAERAGAPHRYGLVGLLAVGSIAAVIGGVAYATGEANPSASANTTTVPTTITRDSTTTTTTPTVPTTMLPPETTTTMLPPETTTVAPTTIANDACPFGDWSGNLTDGTCELPPGVTFPPDPPQQSSGDGGGGGGTSRTTAPATNDPAPQEPEPQPQQPVVTDPPPTNPPAPAIVSASASRSCPDGVTGTITATVSSSSGGPVEVSLSGPTGADSGSGGSSAKASLPIAGGGYSASYSGPKGAVGIKFSYSYSGGEGECG